MHNKSRRGGLNLQDWTLEDEITGMDIARVDILKDEIAGVDIAVGYCTLKDNT